MIFIIIVLLFIPVAVLRKIYFRMFGVLEITYRLSLLFMYKHSNSATVFLLWHAGLFTTSDLERNSCAYNLRTFEFKHFWIT